MGVFFVSQNKLELRDEKKIAPYKNAISSSGNCCSRNKHKPKEADMYSNNLNGSYEYESERRNDERRAVAESQMLHGLGRKSKINMTSPMVFIGVLAVLVAFFHVF